MDVYPSVQGPWQRERQLNRLHLGKVFAAKTPDLGEIVLRSPNGKSGDRSFVAIRLDFRVANVENVFCRYA